VTNDEIAGKSLDDAMDHDDRLWYPQVWPITDEGRDGHLDPIANNLLDGAKTKTRNELFELISLFSENQETPNDRFQVAAQL